MVQLVCLCISTDLKIFAFNSAILLFVLQEKVEKHLCLCNRCMHRRPSAILAQLQIKHQQIEYCLCSMYFSIAIMFERYPWTAVCWKRFGLGPWEKVWPHYKWASMAMHRLYFLLLSPCSDNMCQTAERVDKSLHTRRKILSWGGWIWVCVCALRVSMKHKCYLTKS